MLSWKRWLSCALLMLLLTSLALGGVAAAPTMHTAPQASTCPSFVFIKDVTIPDYSLVATGETFVKTWRVRNNGSCDWPEGMGLVFESGARMEASRRVPIPALAIGTRGDISVTMKAPATTGIYQGAWRFSDDEGVTFGPALTVVVKVVRAPAATATPESPQATATPEPVSATATPVAVIGDCLDASFVTDVTIPDHSVLEASEAFTKTWRVRNTGECPWPEDTLLTHIGNYRLGAPREVAVGEFAPGASAELSVGMRAPATDGNYRGVWRLASDELGEFGITLTVLMQVGKGTPAVGAMATAVDTCLNASYVADVTVPDYTSMDSGQNFVKTWRVRNSGTCPWPDDAQLAFVQGQAMGAPERVPVGSLAPGATTDISVDMAAPEQDGVFKGVWRLAEKDGAVFGTKLTTVFRVGTAPAAAPPPVVPSGGGGNFELGGHIRTWSYIDQMRYAGMNWAKVQVHYGQGAGDVINTAHANGFKIQLSALGSPGMVVEPDFHAKFSAWVAGMAAAGADAIEIWNEPNIDREWQVGHIDPAAYTQLLCAAYGAIKNANSGTAVISAAPAPTGYFGGCGPNGCDDLPFIQGMYNAGAANCMDYIGAHHNSGATSPSARAGHPADGGGGHHSWYFLPQTDLYYRTFGGARQLFYTEMGYASQSGVPGFSDAFWWARGTTNEQQAAWLAEAVNLSRSTGMVRCIIVWNIDFSRYGYDPQDGYAIIRPGGGCPACESLHGVMQ